MMKAMPYWGYMLVVICLASCSKDEAPEVIRTDGLNLIIQNKSESLPAKVSVFF
ncbi:MAG: hypothetical protein HC912_05135 [Saprospiraceae bacterium]|nr:hypothetical protein [Saprospiraceae bacterium]